VDTACRVIPPSRYNRPWRPLDWRNSIEVSTRLASIKLFSAPLDQFFRCPFSESSGVERHSGSKDTDYVLTSCSVIPLYPPSKGEVSRFDAHLVNRADTACWVIPPSRYNRPWRPLDWRNSIEVSTRLASIKLFSAPLDQLFRCPFSESSGVERHSGSREANG
jgi:hypothetical protein